MIKTLIVLISLFSFVSISFGKACDPYQMQSSMPLPAVVGELQEVVDEAECDLATENDLFQKAYIKRFDLNNRKQINIEESGVSFFSKKKKLSLYATDKEIAAMKVLLTEDEIDDYIDENKCTNVICIVESYYGDKEVAMHALTIANKSGYGVAKPKSEDKSWTRSEIKSLARAVEFLPKDLYHLPRAKKLRKVDDEDVTLSVDGTKAAGWTYLTKEADIYLTESTLNGKSDLLNVLTHELYHQHDNENHDHDISIHMNQMESFKEFTGYERVEEWIEDENGAPTVQIKTKFKEGLCFPSEYAKHNEREYYAEMMTDYTNKGRELKAKCPDVYEFAKNEIFKGKEFINHNNDYSDEELGTIIGSCMSPNIIDSSVPDFYVTTQSGVKIRATGGAINNVKESCKEKMKAIIGAKCGEEPFERERKMKDLLSFAESKLHDDIQKGFSMIKKNQIAQSCKKLCYTPQISDALILEMRKNNPNMYGKNDLQLRNFFNRIFLGVEFSNQILFD